jgi:hypothetical protein
MLNELGEKGEAEAAYRAGAEHRTDWAEPLLILGRNARQRGELEAAARFQTRAALAEPARDAGLVELAETLALAPGGGLRAILRDMLDADVAAGEAVVALDISDLVDRWLHEDAPDAAARGQLALLREAGVEVRFCCLTADRNDWVEVPSALLGALRGWTDDTREAASRTAERTGARLRLMAAEALPFRAGAVLIGLGAPVRITNYFLSIRAMQRRFGLCYLACLPDPLPSAGWLAEMADHAAGVIVGSAVARDALPAEAGQVRVASFGQGWPMEIAGFDWKPVDRPVRESGLGQWQALDATGERFRAGQGWHVPDADGCRTLGAGGELAIGMPEGARTPRLYLRLRGLPQGDCRYALKIENRPRIEGIVHAGEDKWIALDVPVPQDGVLRLFLRGERQEGISADLGAGLRRYPVSIGVAGFCLVEKGDHATRRALLETIERAA